MEIWKLYKEKYEISTHGNMRNINTGRILYKNISKKGYVRYNISINCKRESLRAHRAVAFLFIPNLENKTQVNHKDGNKLNNNIENLEWVSGSENTKHAYANNLRSNISLYKSVSQFTKDNIFIRNYISISHAANENNFNVAHISGCCNGRCKTHKNFIWKFTQEHQSCGISVNSLA